MDRKIEPSWAMGLDGQNPYREQGNTVIEGESFHEKRLLERGDAVREI